MDRTRAQPFLTPEEWGTEHPFRRLFNMGDKLDFTVLFRDRMRFVDSASEPGVRLADLCANLIYRQFNAGNAQRPYEALRPMIQAERSEDRQVSLIHLVVPQSRKPT